MKKYLFCVFLLSIALNIFGENKVAGIEIHNYIFKVSVFDGKDVFSKSMRITVLPKREGLILRLGKGLIKQR